MASLIGIYNRANYHLSKRRVDDPNQSSSSAIVFRDIWDDCFEEVIEEYPWQFCMMEQFLPLDLQASSVKWPYGFTLPTGEHKWHKIWNLTDSNGVIIPKTNRNRRSYEIIGNHIFCMYDEVVLIYCWKNEDPNQMPAHFRGVMSLKLAHESCMKITGNASLRKELGEELKDKLMKARTLDAQNANLPDLSEGEWLAAHYANA